MFRIVHRLKKVVQCTVVLSLLNLECSYLFYILIHLFIHRLCILALGVRRSVSTGVPFVCLFVCLFIDYPSRRSAAMQRSTVHISAPSCRSQIWCHIRLVKTAPIMVGARNDSTSGANINKHNWKSPWSVASRMTVSFLPLLGHY